MASQKPKEEEDLRYRNATKRIRDNGLIEIRYRKDGYNKSFYGRIEKEVNKKYLDWYNQNFKNNKLKTIAPNAITVEQWCIEWLEIYKKPIVGEATFLAIKSVMFKYIVATIGAKTLKSLTPKDIDRKSVV